jgi:hypothetical protein
VTKRALQSFKMTGITHPPPTRLEFSATALWETQFDRHSLSNRVNTHFFFLCDYEEYHLLGCDAMSCYGYVLISHRNTFLHRTCLQE